MALLKAWIEKERYNGQIVDCLTLILPTRGCSWGKCYMCSYYLEAKRDATPKYIETELDRLLEKKKADLIKIFTSGSFFDDNELNKDLRKRIYDKLRRKGFKKLIVESRPEFISEDTAREIQEAGIEVEVGIGVETSNDYYREKLINKGFTFNDFVEASKILREVGRVKVYLLLKPPLLSEKEAIDDVLKSIEDVQPHSDIISLNLMTIHKRTLVERLWKLGAYRPPWLWSAVEILKKANVEIICDPVAAGKIRGPHNCFKCDNQVAKEIKEFSLTQDKGVFKTECECKKIWKLCLKGELITDAPLTP